MVTMADGALEPTTGSPPKPITVQQEWVVIGISSGVVVALSILGCIFDRAAFLREKPSTFSILQTLAWWLGHGVWLSMDRRRRGLEMRGWRYAVIFLGPLAIWLY
jgi:hypothetical protein